ncbi:MAG: hypothetical protein HY340_01110 [Candidatus Kerfeldbacteria bacterium]|nr:hypothetical protein [Candidatus Kerfeldbacteria bacterium]
MRRHSPLIFLIAIVLASTLAGWLGLPTHAAESAPAEPVIVMQIPIPGVTFACPGAASKQCVRSLGDYINGVYRYFAGAISIVAAVLVMWGGVKWLTAAGNAGRVNDAKETIYSAIIALFIVFGSYIILYTINPRLVKLELPNINAIVGIEQARARCSQNPISLIEGGGCPSGRECCGQTMQLNIGAGRTGECVWDLCNDREKICVIADTPLQYGNLPSPPCIDVDSFCERTNFPGPDDERNWCPAVDTLMRQAKSHTAGAAEFAQKFRYTGCGLNDLRLTTNQCLWGVTFDKFFELYPERVPNGFQPQFIDCYTAGAEGVCWERVDGQVKAKDCSGPMVRPCRNVTDVPRPVAGTAGSCLVKVDRTGSADPDDYKCWSVPFIDPKTAAPGGWGEPLSY